MNTKTFLEDFLENEEDWVILDSYYILTSTRIRTRGKYKTIQSAASIFSPSASVLYQENPKSMKKQYMYQIDVDAKVYLATIIKGCIKKNYNIIFLCTKNESKGHYLEYIAEYVKKEFQFPMYDYGKFIRGKENIFTYQSDEVLSKCNAIIKSAKEQSASYINDLSKKKLIKELRKVSFYPSGGETKKELQDILRELKKDKRNLV